MLVKFEALERELERLEGIQDKLQSKSKTDLSLAYVTRLEHVTAEARAAIRDFGTGDLAKIRKVIIGSAHSPLRLVWATWRKHLNQIIRTDSEYQKLLGLRSPPDRALLTSLKGVWPAKGNPTGLIGHLYKFDDVVKHQVADIVTRSIIGSVPRRNSIKAIDQVIGRSGKIATQIMHDGTMVFSRTVSAIGTTDYEYFMYSGPVDKVTRSFCLKHESRIYTREEISRLDNGQTPDVFLDGGGYNCRHVWRPVRRSWFSEEEWEEKRGSDGA